VVARESTTLDVLSSGRTILGVGLGGPDHGDFGLFNEVTDRRTRAEMLDESLAVLDGLWSGEWFAHRGDHYELGPVRFTPTPVQRPRIPVWVGGVLPNPAPISRAARWDGAVPITYDQDGLARPTVEDIAGLSAQIAGQRDSMAGYDVAVWAEVAQDRAAVEAEMPAYADAGATWWIETARPARDPDWLPDLVARIKQGR
jgi:alkanesulfonate monooxygenase SsuD/methylene tetrahydromethanopterin reductase-like flavin-dependent oxidoreductase (luciferase family)